MAQLAEFLSGLGVNVHMDALDTPYGNPDLVAASLGYLGISLIRDHAYDTDVSAYQTLISTGVHLDLIVDSAHPGAELTNMLPVAGSVVSLEGPNEPDVYLVERATPHNFVAPAVAEQTALYLMAKASPAYATKPILNLSMAYASDYPAFSASIPFSDVANLHAYAGSAPPAETLQEIFDAETPVPGQPVEITETGYYTLPSDPDGVDETVQAKFTIDTLFDAAALGVRATFLYELLDEAADPAGTDSQLHYGLFHADGTPKLAATALHNLTATLDAAATAGSALTPALTVNPTVSGLPDSGQWLQLANPGGPSVIAVWAEPELWDPATAQEIPADPATVTIQLGAVAATVEIYDPLVGTAPIARATNTDTVTVTLTDHPLVIEAMAAAAAASGGSSPSGAAPGQAASPGIPTVVSTTTDAVYRFFDKQFGTHFYTDNIAEKDTIAAQDSTTLVYEGVGLQAVDPASNDPNATPIFRFFDSVYGTHFFTASATERDSVLATRPDLLYEGVGFEEHADPQPGDIPVYRFFDSANGTHFYTSSASEQALVIATRPDLVNEGIGFYAPT